MTILGSRGKNGTFFARCAVCGRPILPSYYHPGVWYHQSLKTEPHPARPNHETAGKHDRSRTQGSV